jgi:hypothetical protein
MVIARVISPVLLNKLPKLHAEESVIVQDSSQPGQMLRAKKDRANAKRRKVNSRSMDFELARLRIAKSLISKRSFSFQKTIDLRGKNAIFQDQSRVHDWGVKHRHSSKNSSTRTGPELLKRIEYATNFCTVTANRCGVSPAMKSYI